MSENESSSESRRSERWRVSGARLEVILGAWEGDFLERTISFRVSILLDGEGGCGREGGFLY